MNKMDPRLFAIGTGAVAGVNVLATDNDPLAIASGLAIGGGAGALMNISMPDDLNDRANRSINNVRKNVDITTTTGRVQTFNELKISVQDLASNMAKTSTSTATEFDRRTPFGSLNKNTYDDFTRYISNMTSEESLKELQLALQNKSDDIFLHTSDIDRNLAKDVKHVTKVKEGANLKSKRDALSSELRRMGYRGDELNNKLLMFEPLLKDHKANIQIGDGVLDLDGVGKIQLTHEIGTGNEKALVYANNRNMYDVKRVNVFGSSILADKDSTAVAKAIGIEMADLFDLNAQFNSVKGMAPDDAIAMLAGTGKLSKEQLRDFVSAMNSNYNYNENMSGDFKSHLLGHGGPVNKPSSYSIASSNTVDYKTTLNLTDEGTLDTTRPFSGIGITSRDGIQKSPIKQLQDKLSKMTNTVLHGVSADHVTQLPATGSVTNSPFSLHSPIERNPMTVNNRLTVATLDTNINNTVKDIVNALGGKHQYASAVAMQAFSINPETELVDINDPNKKINLSDKLATMFGSDKSTGDGYGLANKNITNRVTTEGISSLVMKKTASNNYLVTNAAMKKHLLGQLSIDDMRREALTGSTMFSNKTEAALIRARDRLEGLSGAFKSGKAEEIFDVLKGQHRSFGKYNSYQDFLKANKGLGQASDKFAYMQDLATKTSLGSALKPDSLYSQNRKENSHIKIVNEMRKVDKQFTRIKQAVSSSNFSGATDILNDLLAHNETAKLYRESAEAYFPKPGSRIGFNSDMSPLTIKESYKFLEFEGVVRAVDGSTDDVREAIQFMYKGINKAGLETISKTYGVSSKEQLRHVDGDVFGRMGLLHSLAKDGKLQMDKGAFVLSLANSSKPVRLKQSQLTGSNLMKEMEKVGASKADIAMVKERLDFFKNVGTISEESGSSMRNAETLYKNLANGDEAAIRTQLTSSTIADSLMNRVKSGNLSENQLKGLSNFAISLSHDKASADYLITSLTSLKMSSDLKVSNYTNAVGTADADNQLHALRTFAADTLGDKSYLTGNFNIKKFDKAFTSQQQWMMSFYQDPAAVAHLVNSPGDLNRLSSVFMAERTYRDSSIGDSVLKLASFNTRTEFETGAGKIGKSMSWNSQTQLKMNGMTDSDLAFFGKFNTSNMADLKAVMSIRLENVATINSQINESNIKEVSTALRQNISKKRDALANAGVKIDDLHGTYQLSTPNKLGFKNVPIMLEDTSLFGSYTDKDGMIQDRNLNTVISKIIDDDLKLRQPNLLKSERQAYQTRIDEGLTHLANTLKTSLGGQDNLMKKAYARDATHSRYSTMVPVGGSLNELSETKSAVSVSSEGLLKRFQQLGFDYKSMKDIEKGGHLEKSKGGLLKVFADRANNVPLFGIINREPATGPGSARFVEYYLDKTLANDSKSLNIGRDDRLYKYFQFGDFDLDHTLEYMPDFKSKQYDPEIFKNMLAKGTKVNQDLFDTVEYARLLGVKGSGKNQVKSLFQVYEENQGNFKSTADWYDKYAEEMMLSKQKAGDRKSISPTVTKLAADINDAIAGSGGDEAVAMRSRVLSHYFVENLLKSQHIDNKTYGKNPVSVAEQLSKYMYEKGTDRSRFNQEFANYIEDTVIKNIKASDMADDMKKGLIDQTEEAIKLIQTSVSKYDPDAGPKNPMVWAKTQTAEKVPSSIDNLIKAITGKAANVRILGVSEEFINEGNELSLAQRGKLGYHKALEILKHNIGNNKKLLATTAGITVGAALLTQKTPQFGESRAEANPSGMLMAPSKSMLEDTANQASSQGSLNRAVEYIRPYRKDNSYVGIQASQTGENRNLNQDIEHFMFGDGLSSARIINNMQS